MVSVSSFAQTKVKFNFQMKVNIFTHPAYCYNIHNPERMMIIKII